MKETIMEKEARQAPDVIEKQFKENKEVLSSLCARIKANPPAFAMTIGRGSSDHAATFAKYLFETRLDLVTSSAAPSVLTLYREHLKVKGGLIIGISQSGGSPDICQMMKDARRGGAVTVALVNKLDSPLAAEAEYTVPLWAGAEEAVAATKSYLASLAALLQFVAVYLNDRALLRALDLVPGKLRAALAEDWSLAIPALKNIVDAYVVGRGYGFPVAEEAALKFKEAAAIHAEAFSGAEILHGPFALIKKDYTVLLFTQADASLAGMLQLAEKIRSLGAKTLVAAAKDTVSETEFSNVADVKLPLPEALHPLCDPLLGIQAFYPLIARVAVERGYNPDNPEQLKKVTETI